ncbi:MAG: SAVED domain-containing protein [Phycisphaerales bacterium]|nr:SAVED domain-containing protein [Phycisphaerales bacterium]
MRVRRAVREALAGLKEVFPNLNTIHMFIAAPVSVCFAIGQELKPRNSPPIQTYRFRRVEGQPAFKPALVLRGGEGEFREAPLSPAQVSRAQAARGIWSKVIADIEGYSANRPAGSPPGAPWYASLEPRDALERAAPFPSLKPLRQLMPDGAAVDPSPFPAEYGFDKDRKLWRISDRLLLGLDTAASSDEARLQQIIRLFLFHEYLHDFHSLTKYTAAEVGKFANCLEFIDYTADAYALVHQLDCQHLYHHGTVKTDDAKREFLADQIDLVIRSFWAFEPAVPVLEWQLRRMLALFELVLAACADQTSQEARNGPRAPGKAAACRDCRSASICARTASARAA